MRRLGRSLRFSRKSYVLINSLLERSSWTAKLTYRLPTVRAVKGSPVPLLPRKTVHLQLG